MRECEKIYFHSREIYLISFFDSKICSSHTEQHELCCARGREGDILKITISAIDLKPRARNVGAGRESLKLLLRPKSDIKAFWNLKLVKLDCDGR
jgi:hypothetical protein